MDELLYDAIRTGQYRTAKALILKGGKNFDEALKHAMLRYKRDRLTERRETAFELIVLLIGCGASVNINTKKKVAFRLKKALNMDAGGYLFEDEALLSPLAFAIKLNIEEVSNYLICKGARL